MDCIILWAVTRGLGLYKTWAMNKTIDCRQSHCPLGTMDQSRLHYAPCTTYKVTMALWYYGTMVHYGAMVSTSNSLWYILHNL
jgi:hypothetical protein